MPHQNIKKAQAVIFYALTLVEPAWMLGSAPRIMPLRSRHTSPTRHHCASKETH
jgi:hypothetical protein